MNKKPRTIYLTPETDTILENLYIEGIKNKKKKSLSVIIEKAIKAYYENRNNYKT